MDRLREQELHRIRARDEQHEGDGTKQDIHQVIPLDRADRLRAHEVAAAGWFGGKREHLRMLGGDDGGQ